MRIVSVPLRWTGISDDERTESRGLNGRNNFGAPVLRLLSARVAPEHDGLS
jgi:hypothetical protein